MHFKLFLNDVSCFFFHSFSNYLLHSLLAFFFGFFEFLDIISGDPRYVIEAFSFRCKTL